MASTALAATATVGGYSSVRRSSAFLSEFPGIQRTTDAHGWTRMGGKGRGGVRPGGPEDVRNSMAWPGAFPRCLDLEVPVPIFHLNPAEVRVPPCPSVVLPSLPPLRTPVTSATSVVQWVAAGHRAGSILGLFSASHPPSSPARSRSSSKTRASGRYKGRPGRRPHAAGRLDRLGRGTPPSCDSCASCGHPPRHPFALSAFLVANPLPIRVHSRAWLHPALAVIRGSPSADFLLRRVSFGVPDGIHGLGGRGYRQPPPHSCAFVSIRGSSSGFPPQAKVWSGSAPCSAAYSGMTARKWSARAAAGTWPGAAGRSR